MIGGAVARLVPAVGRGRRGRWLRGDRLRVWAHRGASAAAVENTVAAFERARADGADGVELDVTCCATGEVVVFHDDDLRRLAGRPERIDRLPWSALREVDLGGGARVPLLADALAACGPLPVDIELKSPGPGRAGPLPGRVARVVAAAGAGRRVVVSSFDPVALVQLHLAAPDLATALLVEARAPRALLRAGAAALVGASAIHPEDRLCTPERVAGWHRAGLAVGTWTVDDPDRLRALAAMGVDWVCANDPRAAGAALARPGGYRT